MRFRKACGSRRQFFWQGQRLEYAYPARRRQAAMASKLKAPTTTG
jgi:hypothetical protein